MKTAALACTVALLAGCGAPKPLTTADVQKTTQVRDTQFDARIEVVGPEQQVLIPRGMLNDRITWRTRIFIDKATGITTRQLYVKVWHQDSRARRYRTASLIGGEQLPITSIDYKPSCMAGGGIVSCTHDETFAVILPESAWAKALDSELPVRLNAQSGDQSLITIHSAYAVAIDATARARSPAKP